MKKKVDSKYKIIQNPASPLASTLPRFSLILCLPSIFVLLFLSNDADMLGIFIYLAIFIFFISLGFRLLFSAKGDYYLDKDGIHFIRNENSIIYYCDIKKSKWLARNYTINKPLSEIHITSVTRMVVKGRGVIIYNLSEKQYWEHINFGNIFLLVNDKVKTSLFHKLLIAFLSIVSICAVIVFTLYMSYSSKHGGGAINAIGDQGISYLWMHTNVQHYVADHGVFTVVSYQVWKNILKLEIASAILIPLTVICGLVNIIWYGVSSNRTKEKRN